MQYTLSAKKRTNTEQVSALRAEQRIPAVIYDRGNDSKHISISYPEFIAVYKRAGSSAIITLDLDGEQIDTIVHDRQKDNATGHTIHIDFMPVVAGEKIAVTVPLNFTGESPAVKSGLGVLSTPIHELEIKCFPKEIPHDIQVDISGLEELRQQITLSDLLLPDSAEHDYEPTLLIVSVGEIQEEVEPEESAEIDFDAIGDAEQRGKQDGTDEQASGEEQNE